MERGDVILDGLLKTVAGLLVVALVLFEAGAVALNHVQARDAARSLARTGVTTLEERGAGGEVEAAVEEAAAEHSGLSVDAVAVDTDTVEVTVRRHPDVLVIGRVDAISERISTEVTEAAPPR